MTRNSHVLPLLGAALAAIALAGCASSSGRAPVVDLGVAPGKSRPAKPTVIAEAVARHAAVSGAQDTYVVQKGDTLYSIAFNFGLDYHELAEYNGIQDPSAIQIGQELKLLPAGGAVAAKPAVQAKAVDLIKDKPKAVKLPYSEQAVAQIDKMQQEQAVAAVKPETAPAPAPRTEAAQSGNTAAEGDVAWGMPANGKLIAGFSENDGRKGIDIAGKLGQPVFASAGGKVVYSGSGLRGYGKLVIIKHNNTYLSAYAHNNNILVKEGQNVAKGQKIAEMGNTDADRVELHFEIRKLGKPVDPAQYLNLPQS